MAKSVLVVEPMLSQRSLWEALLREAGFHTRGVADGLSALTALQEEPADLALVAADLPDMDGYRLCAALRRLPDGRQIQGVVLTMESTIVAQARARTSKIAAVLSLPGNQKDVAKFLIDLPAVCLRVAEERDCG